MVEYRALGGLTVVSDGGEVSVGGARQRRLVAMLLMHRNQVVSADRLSEAVFAGEPTSAAGTTLRSYVARLRRVVDGNGSGSVVVTRAPGYMLEVRDGAFDVACFERLVGEGRSRLERDDAVAASSALREALALWRGDAYGEFADEDWVRPEAQRLGELHLVAYEGLVDAELACGRAAEMIPELETLVAEHPLRESFRGQLMLALYRSGRQVDALRVFQEFRQVLGEELGLDPSPELVELDRRIVAHDPGLRLAEPAGLPLRGYRLGERLGTGREGTVYAARLPGVEREFAVRILRPEIADDPEFVRSFEADAQAVASLRHEAIVAVHDYWREPGAAYVVMRRMSGGTLRDRLDHGPVGGAEVTAMATRVGSALTAAAERGIVHGRLVPESVLFDDAGVAFLSDFALGTGVARPPGEDVRGYAALVCESLTGHPPVGSLVEGVPAAVADVLAQGLARDGRPPLAVVAPALAAALAGQPAGPQAEVPNPYKGLRAFAESDADDFFGRDGLVDEMLGRLAHDDQRGRLVLVVGGSGSGKSSVVRAGLVPRLRRGEAAGSERWFVTDMLPGGSPFKELAEGLRRIAVTETEGLADELALGEGGVDEALRRLVPDGGQLLLVVDQFEELFTLAGEGEQRAFLDGLTHAISTPDSRLRVVATLRGDFYDRPLGFRRFGALVRDATVTVPAMSAADLEAAVVGPAERVGAVVEPALVAELVAAVVDEPAALPSLQYTLYELADRSPDRWLTLAAYGQLGGVDAAIAARAEQLYRSLDDAERETVRRVFERLVVVSGDGEPTRRRAPRAELTALGAGQPVDDAIDTWAQARLLTLDRHPATRQPTVEVAHEALLREWPRLRGWIDEHRDNIVALAQLRDAATTWAELDRDPGALYRGVRLGVALDVTEDHPGSLPAREREFLDASREARDQQQRREAERIARQARANRRLRIQLAALAVALVVALVVGFVAVDQRQRANNQADVATARELAAAAEANLDADPERSILLALEAVEQSRTDHGPLPEAEEALHRAVTASRIELSVTGVGGTLDWSPEGTIFVTEGPEDSGIVDIRDAHTGESVRSFHGHEVDINDVAFSHDGSLLATTGDDGAARIWDPNTGEELWTIQGQSNTVWGPSFSPDGSRLVAVWLDEGVVRVTDLATGQTVQQIPSRGAHFAKFSPDGERLAMVGENQQKAVVVDADTGEEVFTLEGHRLGLRNVGWSPDGKWIATTSDDGTARIWEAETGRIRFTLFGHASVVPAVAWSPDSTRLVTGSYDGTAKVWRIADDSATETLSLSAQDTRNGIWAVAFSPDGTRVMAGNLDATAVKVWDVSLAGDEEWANVPAVPFFLGSAAFTTDGGAVVASSADGSVTVWDSESAKRLLTFGPRGPATLPGGAAVLREGPASVTIDQLLDAPPGADVLAIDVSPDGQLIATASADGSAKVWDAATGEGVFALEAGDPLYDVAWSPDGQLLAVAGVESDRGVVTIVERSGAEVATLRDEPGVHVTDVRFDPEGRLLATAREPQGRFEPDSAEVAIWDWEQAETVKTIETHADSAVFDPTGTRLATTGRVEGVADIWDARSGQRLVSMTGHKGLIGDVVFSPDGSRLATAGQDGTVRLWDAESGSQTLVLRGHIGMVSTVVFSPDGSKLASVSADGTVRVWALDLDDLIEIAKDKLTRTLTDEECRQYLHVDRCSTDGATRIWPRVTGERVREASNVTSAAR
jgi:WD40 repeat protein/DNA-binding SARP family transcriptional activator